MFCFAHDNVSYFSLYTFNPDRMGGYGRNTVRIKKICQHIVYVRNIGVGGGALCFLTRAYRGGGVRNSESFTYIIYEGPPTVI